MPVVALVVASALWGVATSATKYALAGFDPVGLLAIELVAATVALWVGLLGRGYRPPPSWRLALVLGLLEPGVAYLGETVGLDHTSASNAALIFGLESTFVVLLAAVFLHERVSVPIGLSVLTGLLGLATLESITSLDAPGAGDSIVLVGALSAAGYSVVVRGSQDAPDPLALTAHQFAFASMIISPIAVLGWLTGHESAPTHVEPHYWMVAVLVGVGGFAVPFLLYNWAIAYIAAGASGVIINLIPAFALVSAMAWLGEPLTPARLVGGGLIAVSVAIFSWTEVRGSADEGRQTAEPSVRAPVSRPSSPPRHRAAEALGQVERSL